MILPTTEHTNNRISRLENSRGETPRLELQGMTKIYPSTIANDGIDLKVMPGEIHAVLGENGAGKSTLMKAIYGVVKPDKGQILWEGNPVTIDTPAHARRLGIGMVFQHFSLFETLTVTENIALAMENIKNMDALSMRIREVSNHYGLPLDPGRLVHSLSVGLRQRVEIVRCLLQARKLLIMDEPTSVLTPQSVRKLFETLRKLSEEGCSILYISHKLDEIQVLCHKATIIRSGKVTGIAIPSRETPSSLARMMIGKELPVCSLSPRRIKGEKRLEVNALSRQTEDPFGTNLKDINLYAESGEILGIAGISGNGQQEFLDAISGEKRSGNSHEIVICGVSVGHLGPGERRDLGMCFVPEERIGRGAVPGLSLMNNSILTAFRQGMVRLGVINLKKAAGFTEKCIVDFDVKCGGLDQPVTCLSGGNLQKFIIGREIQQAPKLLIVAQPTWGVDVGAANVIRQSLIDLRNRGTAVLVVSEELDELFEFCDRIVVIAEGYVSRSKFISETSKEEIGVWMSGLFPNGPANPENAHPKEQGTPT